MVKLQKLSRGLVPGVSGAALGMVTGIIQMLQIEPVNSLVNAASFQNFAIYTGLGIGLLFGLVAYAAFMVLYRRFQYPASSRLGVCIGAVGGALLCFSTNLIINISAPSSDFIRNGAVYIIISGLEFAFVGGAIGLVVGYFMAEIGARNLHYR